MPGISALAAISAVLALIMVYLGGALGANSFLIYGFFTSVPKEIDEAAKIDGATHAQTYWTIVLPLVVPILAVVGLLGFISSFAEFVVARVGVPSALHRLWPHRRSGHVIGPSRAW